MSMVSLMKGNTMKYFLGKRNWWWSTWELHVSFYDWRGERKKERGCVCVCVCSGRKGKGKDGSFPQLGLPQPEFTWREKSLTCMNKSWRSGRLANQRPKFMATWCFPPAGAGEHIPKDWSGVKRDLCLIGEGRLWRCHLHTSQHLLYKSECLEKLYFLWGIAALLLGWFILIWWMPFIVRL